MQTIKKRLPVILVVAILASAFMFSQIIKPHLPPASYLYFNDRYYYVSNAPVQEHEIGVQLGEIVRHTAPAILRNNRNGDSNSTSPVGSRIFSFKNDSENLGDLAIEDTGATYRRAYPIVNKASGSA